MRGGVMSSAERLFIWWMLYELIESDVELDTYLPLPLNIDNTLKDNLIMIMINSMILL